MPLLPPVMSTTLSLTLNKLATSREAIFTASVDLRGEERASNDLLGLGVWAYKQREKCNIIPW